MPLHPALQVISDHQIKSRNNSLHRCRIGTVFFRGLRCLGHRQSLQYATQSLTWLKNLKTQSFFGAAITGKVVRGSHFAPKLIGGYIKNVKSMKWCIV